MKRILCNWRYYLLAVLGLLAVVGLFSEPLDNEEWLNNLIVSKSIGFISTYLLFRLTILFEKSGKIKELTNLFKETEQWA